MNDLARPGYSPDEEFTLVAARAIDATGLPMLPSGLLYDRGLWYSYASWAAGALGGQALPAYRVVSLIAACAALAVLYRGLRRVAEPWTASLAVLLTAASLPFWVSATTARFYSPFLLFYLWALLLMTRDRAGGIVAVGLVAASACARWNHELAFTLAGVPLAVVVVGGRQRWSRWAWRFGWTCAGLVAGQAVIMAVHRLAPPTNGDVMIQRFFVWQVLNLFERPPMALVEALPAAVVSGALTALVLAFVRRRVDAVGAVVIALGGLCAATGQLALPLAGALVAIPFVGIAMRQRIAGHAVIVTGIGLVFWVMALTASGHPASDAVLLTVEEGLRYPLDMFSFMAAQTPIAVTATLGLLLARSSGLGGPWTPLERGLHVLWMGWVLWFGIIASGITARYLLLPTTFLLCALVVDFVAVGQTRRWSRGLLAGAAIGLAALAGVESWRGPSLTANRHEAARPTFVHESLVREIEASDLLACTDETACIVAAGRVDVWLALDDFFRERFVVMRQGAPTGAYAGAPASYALLPLLQRAEREGRRLVVFDVLKDVPAFGDSGVLVPRQLAQENLRGEVIAEAVGARLVHVVRRPEATAARASIHVLGGPS